MRAKKNIGNSEGGKFSLYGIYPKNPKGHFDPTPLNFSLVANQDTRKFPTYMKYPNYSMVV